MVKFRDVTCDSNTPSNRSRKNCTVLATSSARGRCVYRGWDMASRISWAWLVTNFWVVKLIFIYRYTNIFLFVVKSIYGCWTVFTRNFPYICVHGNGNLNNFYPFITHALTSFHDETHRCLYHGIFAKRTNDAIDRTKSDIWDYHHVLMLPYKLHNSTISTGHELLVKVYSIFSNSIASWQILV